VLAWFSGVIFTGPAEVGKTCGSAAECASDVRARRESTEHTTLKSVFNVNLTFQMSS
jgi:hypothetical protein